MGVNPPTHLSNPRVRLVGGVGWWIGAWVGRSVGEWLNGQPLATTTDAGDMRVLLQHMAVQKLLQAPRTMLFWCGALSLSRPPFFS